MGQTSDTPTDIEIELATALGSRKEKDTKDTPASKQKNPKRQQRSSDRQAGNPPAFDLVGHKLDLTIRHNTEPFIAGRQIITDTHAHVHHGDRSIITELYYSIYASGRFDLRRKRRLVSAVTTTGTCQRESNTTRILSYMNDHILINIFTLHSPNGDTPRWLKRQQTRYHVCPSRGATSWRPRRTRMIHPGRAGGRTGVG